MGGFSVTYTGHFLLGTESPAQGWPVAGRTVGVGDSQSSWFRRASGEMRVHVGVPGLAPSLSLLLFCILLTSLASVLGCQPLTPGAVRGAQR